MQYIDEWAHVQKVPISQKRICDQMESKDENRKTVIHALDGLLKQGYIRRAIIISSKEDGKGSEKVKYVQLRRV